MTAFRVGMRVRIVAVRHLLNKRFLGKEARIVEMVETVSGPRYGLDICPAKHSFFSPGVGFGREQLEPILDQNQPCTADFKRDMDRLLEGEAVL